MSLPRIVVQLDTIISWQMGRKSPFPEPVELALAAESAGASGIAISYRGEAKQLLKRELTLLSELSTGPVMLLLPPTQEALRAAFESKPAVAVITGEGGGNGPLESYDAMRMKEQLRSFLQNLKDAEVPAAVLIEPDLEQLKSLYRQAVPMVVLNTRKLAEAQSDEALLEALAAFADVVKSAQRFGMDIAVCGALSPREIRLLAPIEEIKQIIIGHWFWSRALLLGIKETSRELKEAIMEGPWR